MTAEKQIIRDCFEQVVELNTDITSAVYEKFVSVMPEVNQHIDYLDDRMKGRMLDQVYQLLMGDVDDNYLKFETHMHQGYGANDSFYRGILNAVKDAVSEVLADNWSQKEEAAWAVSIDRILGEINSLSQQPAPSNP